jgi:hypothetical protein
MTCNYEPEKWQVPLHLIDGRPFIIGGRPWEFSLDLNFYVVRSNSIAPKWMVDCNVAPVVENFFAKWFAAN